MNTQKTIVTALAILFATSATAQEKTATFKVWGNCGMCERTIEKAAKVPGVSAADWDEDTKQMAVIYDDAKTNPDAIQRSIAATGYDTEAHTGDDKAYDNLHGCCKYDRKGK